jgi:hypothetical protein
MFQGGNQSDGAANLTGGTVAGALLFPVDKHLRHYPNCALHERDGTGYTVDLNGNVLNFAGTVTNSGTIKAAVIKGGSGADLTANFNGGAVTGASLAGTIYTLTRTVNYTDVTIASGYTVVLNGNVLNYSGLLTNSGYITYAKLGNAYLVCRRDCGCRPASPVPAATVLAATSRRDPSNWELWALVGAGGDRGAARRSPRLYRPSPARHNLDGTS